MSVPAVPTSERPLAKRLLKWGSLAALLAIVFLFLTIPRHNVVTAAAAAGVDAEGRPLYWFKGNTHSHSSISLMGYTHGDADAEFVAGWYHDHGYHFVSITDHNRFTNPDEVRLAPESRPDFLLLAGMEVTSDYRYPGVLQEGGRMVHSTSLNAPALIDWEFDDPEKAAIISSHVERILKVGGIPVLNHPNYYWQIELQDILKSQDLRFMEIANNHPRSKNEGHPGHRPAVEDLWDQVLSRGRQVFGIAADDAHDFKWWRVVLRAFGYAPPGGAWIMVRAPDLSAGHIARAMREGDFYASTGVYLKSVTVGEDFYEVVVDMERTRHDARHAWIRDAAPVVESPDGHLVIEFIGKHGSVLRATHDDSAARVPLDPSFAYVRARVTYLEKRWDPLGRDRARAFYAWTQPVMVDHSRP